MEKNQIENVYKANGLADFRLRNTEDLLKVHGIDFKDVSGYSGLNDLNRAVYEKFIVNIFNAFELESRSTLIPTAINFVKETNFIGMLELGCEDEEDSYVNIYTTVNVIDRNGLESLLHKFENKEYRYLKVITDEVRHYLRFEYTLREEDSWLHVFNDKEWF